MQRIASRVAELVAFACRRPRLVVALTVLLSLAAGAYAAARFAIHTEMTALIPADVPWRVREQALETAFVQQGDEIMVVIDGRTPELAESAASRLAAALAPRRDLYARVEQPGAGPFFQREGLLFLSTAEVRDTTSALIRAQPLLAPVASDPSLRGVLGSLATGADAVTAGQASPQLIAAPIAALADATQAVEQGRPAYFAWRPLISGHAASAGDLQQFVALTPRLDYSKSDPGGAAIAAARATAARLGLDPAHGVRLRFTGEVVMDADQLATLREATGLIALGSFAVVLVILYLAVRSAKIIAAILATVAAGLALTAAFGLAVYGRFNLISVAFLPLFIGLGVDFAIQYCVRFRAECRDEADPSRAMTLAAAHVGEGLTLAATAIGLGFLSFLPTRYEGVSELGLIAGVGMAVALILTLTFLPALLELSGARSPCAEIGLPMLKTADQRLQSRKSVVLAVTGPLCLAALLLAPRLKFDFDPLSLREPRSESVSTFLELSRNPETAPDALNILSPNLAAARVKAQQLRRLPQVAEVLSVDSLVPADQGPKLALIRDADLLLDPSINPFDVAEPAQDADLVAALDRTARALRTLAAAPAGASVRPQALRLAGLLETARSGPPSLRARLQAVVVAGLPAALGQIRDALSPEPVTLDSLPPSLRADWIAADGRARIEVLPKAAHGDHARIGDFVRAVQAVAPDAVGDPIAIADTKRLILSAFGEAAVLSLAAITLLLAIALRSVRGVVLTLVPVLLSAVLTVGACVVLGQAINLENIISLPLLFGIGVSFNIYYSMAWRAGERALLRSSLTRAIIYSALTTGAAFGALGLSRHPGTASLGILLLISLGWTLLTILLVQPILLRLAWPRTSRPADQRLSASSR
jgi:hopanoid biosynthesis associated RND transporter like protein HpnN